MEFDDLKPEVRAFISSLRGYGVRNAVLSEFAATARPTASPRVRAVHARGNLGTTHISGPLSDFATGYAPGMYIADDMNPPIPTSHWSDQFQKRQALDVVTPVETLMSGSGKANEVDYKTTTDSYAVLDRGLMEWVTWREVNDADDVLAPREEAVENVMNKVLLDAEIRVADFLDTNTNYGTAQRITATAAWSDTTNGDPVLDIHAALAAMAVGNQSSEIRCAIALELWQEAQRHPRLTGLLGANDRGLVKASDFEEFFGVRLFITDAEKNTAARDVAGTLTRARIWDTDKVRFVRVPVGKPTKNSMMFAGRFRIRQAGQLDVGVYEWTDASRGAGEGSIGVKCTRSESDPKSLQNDCGAIITGC